MRAAITLIASMLAADAGQLVIVGADVIDVKCGFVQPDMTVVIDGSRIAAVGQSATLKTPPGATFVNGRGRFLIPGLWDMHVHMHSVWDLSAPDPATRDFFAPRFVASGVTGVRSMWDQLEAVKSLNDDVEEGRFIGPRVVASGNVLDGPKPFRPGATACTTAEEGRDAVRKLKAAGADFVKVYSELPKNVYLAIAAEARADGLPFAGRVPNSVTVIEASAAGQASIEHLDAVERACGNASGEIDPACVRTEIAALIRHETWVTPTLTGLRGAWFADEGMIRDRRVSDLPETLHLFWQAGGGADPGFADLATLKRRFKDKLDLVATMHHAGVRLLTGTDTPNPHVFPGESIHEELALLVEAGLSPLDALRCATSNPAEFLHSRDRIGAVARGRVADLILLNANPLSDITNTRKIEVVILNGRLLRRADLDRLAAAVTHPSAS